MFHYRQKYYMLGKIIVHVLHYIPFHLTLSLYLWLFLSYLVFLTYSRVLDVLVYIKFYMFYSTSLLVT